MLLYVNNNIQTEKILSKVNLDICKVPLNTNYIF